MGWRRPLSARSALIGTRSACDLPETQGNLVALKALRGPFATRRPSQNPHITWSDCQRDAYGVSQEICCITVTADHSLGNLRRCGEGQGSQGEVAAADPRRGDEADESEDEEG